MTSRYLTQMDRVNRLLPNGVPRWIRCYDDEAAVDRYTVVYTGRYTHKTGKQYWYVGMSDAPFHPQGIRQHGEHHVPIDTIDGKWPPAMGCSNHLGKRIRFEDLPQDCQRVVLQDYLYLWDLLHDILRTLTGIRSRLQDESGSHPRVARRRGLPG